jgi:hypothetical protein
MSQIDIHLNNAWAELKELHAAAAIDYDYAVEYLEKNPSKMIQAQGRMERITERMKAINRISACLQLAADSAETVFNEGFREGKKRKKKSANKMLMDKEQLRADSIAYARQKWNF